jgi:type IV pilus assembly protein PilA
MRTTRGFSFVELLVVLAVIAIVLSVAIPQITKFRLNGVETMVAKEMQTIGTAQVQYHSQFGHFAPSLAALGPPARGGVEGPDAAQLLPGSLASGEKNGYLYTLAVTPSGYSLNANPKVFGTSGRRTFYLDQDGIVHQNWGQAPATVESPEFK